MTFGPDAIVLWRYGPVVVNATLAFTWLVMLLLAGGAWLLTRRLTADATIPRWQGLLEALVLGLRDQVREVSRQDPGPYLPFVGTLFLFILAANVLAVVPGFVAPTGSLSTTTALALAVFLAVPGYAVLREGPLAYLRHYVRPTPLMLPFNVIGELSRTVALAVRLFGNIMSGRMIVGIVVGLVPLFFPVVMQVLGLITGVIQAYIFAVLAMVYIASATSAHAAPPGGTA